MELSCNVCDKKNENCHDSSQLYRPLHDGINIATGIGFRKFFPKNVSDYFNLNVFKGNIMLQAAKMTLD